MARETPRAVGGFRLEISERHLDLASLGGGSRQVRGVAPVKLGGGSRKFRAVLEGGSRKRFRSGFLRVGVHYASTRGR